MLKLVLTMLPLSLLILFQMINSKIWLFLLLALIKVYYIYIILLFFKNKLIILNLNIDYFIYNPSPIQTNQGDESMSF